MRDTKPSSTANERAWSAWVAAQWGATPEYRTFDGSRVDVLTDTHAWEVEWVKKWQEAIGQSLYYAAATNRRPAILLLTRGKPTEEVYYLRCLTTCMVAGIELQTLKTT
jgi:hypothetical protein